MKIDRKVIMGIINKLSLEKITAEEAIKMLTEWIESIISYGRHFGHCSTKGCDFEQHGFWTEEDNPITRLNRSGEHLMRYYMDGTLEEKINPHLDPRTQPTHGDLIVRDLEDAIKEIKNPPYFKYIMAVDECDWKCPKCGGELKISIGNTSEDSFVDKFNGWWDAKRKG